MGFTQLFGLFASFEFADFVAPRSAPSLFMSIHYISRGIATFIMYAYIRVLTKYKTDLYFSMSIKNRLIFFITMFILIIFSVITREKPCMILFQLFFHFCQCYVNFHYYFYRMPENILNGQVKSTENAKKSVS